jgi:hypothetical protein
MECREVVSHRFWVDVHDHLPPREGDGRGGATEGAVATTTRDEGKEKEEKRINKKR